MPHKNPLCSKCYKKGKYSKTRHHKWISFWRWGSYGAEQWNCEFKCKKCGHVQKGHKARWGKGTKIYNIEHDGERVS